MTYQYPNNSNGGGMTYNLPSGARIPNSTHGGLNIHASSFQSIPTNQHNGVGSGLMVGVTGLNHPNPSLLHNTQQRLPTRKYDSEPLHHSSSSGQRPNASDRYGQPVSTLHSPSYITTNQSSQASSRTLSRTSSVPGTNNPSRSISPRLDAAQQQQQQQQANNNLSLAQNFSLQQQSSQQQQQSNSLLPSSNSPPQSALQQPLNSAILLPSVTPPPQPRSLLQTPSSLIASPNGLNTNNNNNNSSPAPSLSTPCCSTCLDTRQENAHLRAQLVAYNYELTGLKNSTKTELQKMRTDVTKALVAFESRLHLQMQQQLGFKPDLEPMQTMQSQAAAVQSQLLAAQQQQPSNNIVSQALSQIQAQLDKFEARTLGLPNDQKTHSPGDTPFGHGSKRASWSTTGEANNVANNNAHQQHLINATLSPPQLTSTLIQPGALLAPSAGSNGQQINLGNLNLSNINLANLSHLLNAVGSLQNQMQQQQQQQSSTPHSHLGSLFSPSPHPPQHHHHLPQTGGMTEERLILLAIDILSVHGAVPVGKMGSLLHKAACDHTLPQMLKERYGGLKKFLQSQTQFFTLGTDHPYNPSLSLSPEFLAANPHIRPPEPQPSPPPEPALPPVIGAPNEPPFQYEKYFNGNGSSLLSPLGGSGNAIHREYSGQHNSDSLLAGLRRDALDGILGPGGVLRDDDPFLYEPDAAESDYRARNDSYERARPSAFSKQSSDGGAGSSGANSTEPVSASMATTVGSTPNSSTNSGSTSRTSVASPSEASSGWDKVVSPSSGNGGSVTLHADEDDKIILPLAHAAENSPSLGATEASASANATFFSRLLS